MGKFEAKTKPTAQSVAAFIDAVADPVRREDARRVDAMMRLISGLEPRMWGPSIIGYGEYHYRYATGHEGDAPRLGFSPRKSELVLYVVPYDPEGRAKADPLLVRLGPHRVGKSCLYIRRLDRIEFEVLQELAQLSWNRMAERYPA